LEGLAKFLGSKPKCFVGGEFMRFRFLVSFGIVLLLLVGFPMANCAEAPGIAWSKTYGGKHSERAYAMVETSDGGFAIAGYQFDDIWLVKTDAYGNVLWNRTYGSGCAYALVETYDGGFALAGCTESFNAGALDFKLVRTDAYGNILWNHTYGGPGHDVAYALVEASDGGYVLAGETHPGLTFWDAWNADFWLVKTDKHGNMLWNRTYNGGGFNFPFASYEIAYSLIKTSDGGYALTGTGFWLVKTDVYGNVEWNKTYGGEEARALVATSDGGFALAGSIYPPTTQPDFLLIKTEPAIIPKPPSEPFPTTAFMAATAITTLTAATATAILLHYRRISHRQTNN